jgi:hypothetical protein
MYMYVCIGRTFVYLYFFPGFCATKSTVDLHHVTMGATDIALFEASLHNGTTHANSNASSSRGSTSAAAPVGDVADWPATFDAVGTCPGCITRPSRGIFTVKQILKRNNIYDHFIAHPPRVIAAVSMNVHV